MTHFAADRSTISGEPGRPNFFSFPSQTATRFVALNLIIKLEEKIQWDDPGRPTIDSGKFLYTIYLLPR